MAVNSVTPAQQDAIAGLYAAFWNRAPDTTGFGFWVEKLSTGKATLEQIATEFRNLPEGVAEYPTWSTNADLVTEVYNNVFGRAPDPEGFAFWLGKLNAGVPFPELVVDMCEAAMTNGSADGALFENKIAVGVYVATVAQTDNGYVCDNAFNLVTADPASVGTAEAWVDANNTGATYTLTTNIDTINVTGHAVNTVDGSVGAGQTYQTGDTVNGNGLTKVSLVMDGANAVAANPVVDVNNVASVNVNLASSGAIDTTEYSNVGAINVTQGVAAQALTINNAYLATDYGLSSGRQSNLTIASWADATTGTNDTVNLTLGGTNATTASVVNVAGGGNAIENVNIAVSGTNNIALTAGTGATSYVVTGSGTNTVQIVSASAALVDFSGTTGTNTINMGANLTAADTIVGGSGADTLRIAPAAAAAGRLQVSGVETLAIGATAASSGGWGDVVGIDTVSLVAGAGANGFLYTATQLAGVDTISAASTATAGAVNDLTISGTSADTVSVNHTATAAALTAGVVTLSSGTEVVNLAVAGDADNFIATSEGYSVNGLTNFNVTSTGYDEQVGGTTLVAQTYNVVVSSLDSTGDSTLASVDLSGNAFGTSLTIGAGAQFAQNANVTGGSGIDLIDASGATAGTGVTNLYITGGAGGDIMTAAAYKTTFVIAEGDAGTTAATAAVASNIDQITGFTTTIDKLSLGAAGDATANTGNYVEGAAAVLTYAAALTQANTDLAALALTTQYTQTYAYEYTAAGDSWLFVDYTADGVADAAIQLTLVATAAGFAAGDIIA